MNESLIVIDFDKTLIPFDSFRKFVFLWIKRHPFSLFPILILRLLRIMDAGNFKRIIIGRVIKDPSFTSINETFSNSLFEAVSTDVKKKIVNELQENTTVLLLSASPDVYIEKVGNKLGYNAKGSFFDSENKFVHLFGPSKVEYLKINFHPDRYKYLYAISDSNSDIELLNMFIKSELLNRQVCK